MEIIIAPEQLDIANAYLQFGSMEAVADQYGLPLDKVESILDKKEVKRYIDNVYLDKGYRNRHTLGKLLDNIIDAKLQECIMTEQYTSKDIVDLIKLAHQMRMDEIKMQQNITKQTNVQVNDFSGGGNYGELMKKLLEG